MLCDPNLHRGCWKHFKALTHCSAPSDPETNLLQQFYSLLVCCWLNIWRSLPWDCFTTRCSSRYENELLVRLSTVSFSDDLVQGTESNEGLLCRSCWRCLMLASFWVCSLTHSKISRPCWVRNWKCPSPDLQPLKIQVKQNAYQLELH